MNKIQQRESAVPKFRYGRYQIGDIITFSDLMDERAIGTMVDDVSARFYLKVWS